MGEGSKKQCTTTKECGQGSSQQGGPVSKQQTKRIIGIGCCVAVVAVCAWYVLSSEQDVRSIADVTRPPEGFETALDQFEAPLEEERSEPEPPKTDVPSSPKDSNEPQVGIVPSLDRELELQSLLKG